MKEKKIKCEYQSLFYSHSVTLCKHANKCYKVRVTLRDKLLDETNFITRYNEEYVSTLLLPHYQFAMWMRESNCNQTDFGHHEQWEQMVLTQDMAV